MAKIVLDFQSNDALSWLIILFCIFATVMNVSFLCSKKLLRNPKKTNAIVIQFFMCASSIVGSLISLAVVAGVYLQENGIIVGQAASSALQVTGKYKKDEQFK